MAKTNLCKILAMLFGLGVIGFMVSTIVLAVRVRNQNDELKAMIMVPTAMTTRPRTGKNPCVGTDPKLSNTACMNATIDDVGGTIPPQSGANVTEGYVGKFDTMKPAIPVTTPFFVAGLCPVNVHWHLGTEHTSVGQYDEANGKGPTSIAKRRKLAGKLRKGGQCSLYDKNVEKFTKPFDWQHCVNMEVGQTYEVHWPHSIHGDCGTPNQYQEPFYDGVFCNSATYSGNLTLPFQVGVQAQVFVIVNDESFYYPDLIGGMLVDGEAGQDIAIYTGSTTGTSRDNEVCSVYGPLTWQVDRTCNMVSASSFDKMCADMLSQRDDMSRDLYPHGSRIVVSDDLASLQQP